MKERNIGREGGKKDTKKGEGLRTDHKRIPGVKNKTRHNQKTEQNNNNRKNIKQKKRFMDNEN